MRNLFHHILLCCLALILTGACQKPVIELMEPVAEQGRITLVISSKSIPMDTRADGHNSSVSEREALISHLDVIIFTAVDNGTEVGEEVPCFYHERVMNPGNDKGTITLKKKRGDFDENDTYYVYIIANSTAPSTDFDDITLLQLKSKTQYDQDIDLMGSNLTTVKNHFFLMDGAAFNYDSNADNNGEPSDEEADPLQLNDGVESNSTKLGVNLRRAAAKIVIYLQSSADVRFDNDETVDGTGNSELAGSIGYYFQHLTTETHLLPPARRYSTDGKIDLTTENMKRESGWDFSANNIYLNLTEATEAEFPKKANNKYISKITVVGYAYAHVWKDMPAGHDTKLVVNLPMWYNEKVKVDGVETDEKDWKFHGNNFYQVPLSRDERLDRNTMYIVNATVNAVGSTSVNSAQTLEKVTYDVMDWTPIEVEIGEDSENKPVYLSLNEDHVEMYNLGVDNTLEFASSSNIDVEVVNYFFIDADGEEVYHDTGLDKDGKAVTGQPDRFNHKVDENGNLIKFRYRSYGSNKSESAEWRNGTLVDPVVEPSWTSGLNGKITINSTPPQNCAVRYIILKITNEDGLTEEVTVAQYPLEYVTHETGWYSYREDFVGTTWQTLANNEKLTIPVTSTSNSISNSGVSIDSGDWRIACSITDGRWSYSSSSGFFESKVARSDGSIRYATWSKRGSTYTRSDNSSASKDNPRMYHLHLMSSSSRYTIGVPRQENGYTAQDDENQLLVSPSLMIASQLAVVSGCPNLPLSADHCKQYVETYKDGNNVIHLDNWRLPTEAELEFIMEYQYLENGVLDEVLAGRWYLSASGEMVENTLRPDKSNEVLRCVRDAYITPNPRTMPVVGYSDYDSNNDGLRPNN